MTRLSNWQPAFYVNEYDGNRLAFSNGAAFGYDFNGNMTSDARKNLQFKYNCLNLLDEAASGGSQVAKYSWLADGTKLQARDASGHGFDYLGSLTYNSSGLEFAQFAGGVIRAGQGGNSGSGNGSGQEINYHLTDHLGSVRAVVDAAGVVKERNDYYPFGLKHTRPDYPQNTNRFDFNGKESQDALGLSFLDYGARMYNPELGRWFNIDPLAEDYVPFSPYNYTFNNPTLLIDPTGMSPIYNLYGQFLGTDDEGLQGNPIFMNDDDFFQGMSAGIAVSFDQGMRSLVDDSAITNFMMNQMGLSQRPDWDGYLTLEEANEWYREGEGKALYVDLNKIDLENHVSLGQKTVGQSKSVSLFIASGNIDDKLVYGTIELKRYPNHTVRAFSDKYDFDMKSWRNPFNWTRNGATIIGGMVAGQGKKYEINIYGSQQLMPILPWVK